MQEPRLWFGLFVSFCLVGFCFVWGFFVVLLEEFVFSLIECNAGAMDMITEAHQQHHCKFPCCTKLFKLVFQGQLIVIEEECL